MDILTVLLSHCILSSGLILLIASQFHGGNRNGIYSKSGDIGGGGGGSQSDTSSNTSVGASKEEKELNKLDLQLRKAAQSGLLNVQDLGLKLSGQLLSGKELPGYLKTLPGGISPEVTQDLVNQSLNDIATSAQYSGILDSGTAGELAARSASDIRTQSAQFNLENLMQLLNLAVSGQAVPVSSALSVGQTLGQRLAGLRSTSSNSTTTSMNWNAKADLNLTGPSDASGY